MEARRVGARKKGALEGRVSLWFLDESGATLTPLVGRTWAPRGKTPRLEHTFGPWTRINIACAISPRGELHTRFKATRAGFTHEDTARFLRDILRHEPGALIVFLDGAAAHSGPAIKALVEANPRLQLCRIPPYAHDLNPADGVFAHMKWHTLRNFAPYDEWEQLRGLRQAAARVRRRPEIIRACFRHSDLPPEDIKLLLAHTGGL